jgi:hypothetical protein
VGKARRLCAFTVVLVPIGLCLRLIGWHAQRSVAALAPIGAQAACRQARVRVELCRYCAVIVQRCLALCSMAAMRCVGRSGAECPATSCYEHEARQCRVRACAPTGEEQSQASSLQTDRFLEEPIGVLIEPIGCVIGPASL